MSSVDGGSQKDISEEKPSDLQESTEISSVASAPEGKKKHQTRVTRSATRKNAPSPSVRQESSSSQPGGQGTSSSTGAAAKVGSSRPSILGQEEEVSNESKSSVTKNPYSQDQMIRVGSDFQATLPHVVGPEERTPAFLAGIKEPATCFWMPMEPGKITDQELEDFCDIARSRYNYGTEQALGLLHWHNYSVKTALCDLKAYVPVVNNWTTEDKVIFEQAFSIHGKNFSRIKQSLPHKTIANLVEFYYNWKNTRNYTSYMGQCITLDSDEESDEDESKPLPKVTCTNCERSTSNTVACRVGSLCTVCHAHWR